MSHDQRPGRLRVVHDPADQQRRGGDAAGTTINGTALTGVAAKGDVTNGEGAPSRQGLPLVGIALYLLACGVGGVGLALLRHAGIV